MRGRACGIWMPGALQHVVCLVRCCSLGWRRLLHLHPVPCSGCQSQQVGVGSHSGRLSVRLASPTARYGRPKNSLLFLSFLLAGWSQEPVSGRCYIPLWFQLQRYGKKQSSIICAPGTRTRWLSAIRMASAPCLPMLVRTCHTVCACRCCLGMHGCPGMNKASCQMQRRLSICDCSTSATATSSPGPGKTCLSPSEASSAGQTDPIESIDSTRLDLRMPWFPSMLLLLLL